MGRNSDYYKEQKHLKLKKSAELKKTLPVYVKSYLEDKELNSQVNTLLSYEYDLITFFNFLIAENPMCKDKKPSEIPISLLEELTFEDINEYMRYLAYSDEHINGEKGIARRMAPLRGFFQYACQHGYMTNDPTLGAAKRKKPPKDDIIRMNVSEVGDMLRTVQNTNISSKRQKMFCEKAQLRDTAIITLLLNTGIRVSECVGLDIDDINFVSRTMYIVRKGGKASTLYFNQEVADALEAYIDNERALLLDETSSDEKALFLSNRRQRICVKSVENIVKKYAKESVPGKHITPHKLRSTYGTALYQQTGDIRLVADVLGHVDINTTSRNYAAIEEEHRQIAAKVDIYNQKRIKYIT